LTGRKLKGRVLDLLKSRAFPENLDQLKGVPARRILTAIFSNLCSQDDVVKWHAVTAMGILVADLANEDLESARNVVRRLMWSLNDESGGIGWGAPEALGEILARHEVLAREFAPILVSYVRENGNFLEYHLLQRGVIWGLNRLAEARSHLLQPSEVAPHLLPFLGSEDPTVRGLTARLLGLLRSKVGHSRLLELLEDETEIAFYRDGAFLTQRVRELAGDALGSRGSLGGQNRQGS
jgi:HEAT repeat protein